MRAITYAGRGSAAGCNGTVLGVSRLHVPGHPSTAFVLVPIGNDKFDVYMYFNGDKERRVAHGVALWAAITLVIASEPGTLEEV